MQVDASLSTSSTKKPMLLMHWNNSSYDANQRRFCALTTMIKKTKKEEKVIDK
jgi:hypothetical protein